MSKDEQIAAAKKQVEGLKAQLAKVSKEKRAGFDGVTDLVDDSMAKTFVTPKVRRTLKGHFGKVYALQWSGNNSDMVSASQDGKLIIWNAKDSMKLQAIPLRSSWVMTCAFEQTVGNLVASGGLDNLCSIYQTNQPQVTRAHRELAGHDGYISSCRFLGESQIITSSGDSTCMLWDVELGQMKQTFADHESDVMALSVLPSVDANIFVSGSCDSTAKVWDVRTGKCTMTLRGHESDINSVCMFPDGKAFGTGSDDSSCKIFDMRAVAELVSFQNEMVLCGVTSVGFSRSGRLLFTGYDNFNCMGWDVMGDTSKNVFTMSGHENRVSCLGVSPDGNAVATGSWDTLLQVWA
jgi:guanine nucleotide-binding protein G(I)/G(S)/G(T) subunit beta-1